MTALDGADRVAMHKPARGFLALEPRVAAPLIATPLALIAAGTAVALLARSRVRPFGASLGDSDLEARFRRVEQAGWTTIRGARESDKDFMARLRDAQAAALNLPRQAGEAVDAFRARVGDAVSTLRRSAALARRGARSTHALFAAHPLAVGAMCVAIGALIGAALRRA